MTTPTPGNSDPEALELLRAQLTGQLESWKAQESRNMEHWRVEVTTRLEAWKSDQTFRLEGFRVASALAQQAIRASFLINGGGAAALLAFLGHGGDLAERAQSSLVHALLAFTLGVALATIATLLAFFAQEHMSIPESQLDAESGEQYRRYSIVVGCASLAAFVGGCLLAAAGFNR